MHRSFIANVKKYLNNRKTQLDEKCAQERGRIKEELRTLLSFSVTGKAQVLGTRRTEENRTKKQEVGRSVCERR